MMPHRSDFQIALNSIESFNSAETESALRVNIEKAISVYGYEFFCCAYPLSKHRQDFNSRVLMNKWPKGWDDQYRHSSFHLHDPVANYTRTQIKSFTWSQAPIPKENPISKQVMDVAAFDYRMKYGFCVPIHALDGYQASISFAGFEIDSRREANAAIELIAIYAANKLTKFKSPIHQTKLLTPREREVMTWTAEGKTAWDIGCILNISEDTVNKHVASAMRRLNVHNRAHAVAESIRLREISL